MKIKTFWVVTKPTPRSLLVDICFETDPRGLSRQFIGGLKPEDIHGIYTEQREAETAAKWLLQTKPTPG